MNCPRCGTFINDGTKFCPNCGEQISSQLQQSNYNQNNSLNMQNNVINDDELINAYIAKDVEKIKKGGFSLSTFCLGGFYMLYRKMWILGIGLFIIQYILSLILKNSIIILIINLILAFFFKKIYLNVVKRNIEKIKQANPNKSQNELVSICAKKGGTSNLALFGTLALILVLGAISGFLNNSQTVTLGNLSVDIPSNFGPGENNDLLNNMDVYGINEDDNYCLVSLYKVDKSKYNSIKDYLNTGIMKKNDDVLSDYKTKMIDGITWNSVTAKNSKRTSYHYAVIKDAYIYEVEFEIYKDDGDCTKAYSTVIDSIELK